MKCNLSVLIVPSKNNFQPPAISIILTRQCSSKFEQPANNSENSGTLELRSFMRMSFKHSDNPTLTVTSEDMNPSSLFRFISPFDQSSVVEFQCSNSSHVSGDEAVTVVQQLSSCIEKFKTRALLMQAEQDSLLMALTLAKDKYCQISSKDGTSFSSFLLFELFDVLLIKFSRCCLKNQILDEKFI